MKLRKLFIVALTFVVVSLFALNFNVSANTVETSELITVQGAQIRTTGNAGIRFVAKEEYAGTNETAYGIILAFGEAEANEEFVIGGTVNGKEVLKGEVQSTKEGAYTATLYNVPEEFYEQKVTARAYVVDGDKVVYSEAVATRSLAEVALAAYEDGDRSEFVVKVYEAIQKAETTLYYNGGEYKGMADFRVTGYNTGGGTGYPLTLSAKDSYSSGSGKYWDRIFVNATETNNVYKAVAVAIEGEVEAADYDYVLSVHSACTDKANRTAFRTIVNSSNVLDYYFYFEIPTEANCNIRVSAATDPKFLGATVVELEEGEALPVAYKQYYDFAGWYDNAEFEGDAIAQHNGAEAYYAKYTPVKYTITYELGTGETSAQLVTEYSVETETIILPEASAMTIADGSFVGWYDNAQGSGEAITEIPQGSNGNITLYAVWAMNTATVVELTAADAKVISKYSPNKFVISSATAGNYNINEKEYVFGTDVFASLDDAITASAANDIIYVFAGSYQLQKALVADLTILGPNADLGSQAVRNSEANIAVKIKTVYLDKSVTFNGLTLVGVGAGTGGEYFYANATLKNCTFQSCDFSKMATATKFTTGSAAIINVLDCRFSKIGQFAIWVSTSSSSNVQEVNVKGCYFDADGSGVVSNTAASMIRICAGNTYVYNNTFVGDLPSTSGGYVCNRSTGTFEVKYNTFKDVTKIICFSSATTHTFDCNLYLTADVAATSSPVSGTGVTADTTVATSVQDLAEKWAAFNNAQ